MIKKFLQDESGQGMVEYILIVALIAVAAIASVKLFGGRIQDLFGTASKKLASENSNMK